MALFCLTPFKGAALLTTLAACLILIADSKAVSIQSLKEAKKDFLALLLLAAIFTPIYLYDTYNIPWRTSTDELCVIDASVNALTGDLRGEAVETWGPSSYFGFPTLIFTVFGTIGSWMGGINFANFRLIHPTVGILIILFSFCLFRLISPLKIAIIAALVLGFNNPLIVFSRMALRDTSGLFCEVLALAFAIFGLKNKNLPAAFLSGIFMGLGFYTYFPGRVTIFIWTATILLLVILHPSSTAIKALTKQYLTAGLAFAMTITPWVTATLTPHPERFTSITKPGGKLNPLTAQTYIKTSGGGAESLPEGTTKEKWTTRPNVQWAHHDPNAPVRLPDLSHPNQFHEKGTTTQIWAKIPRNDDLKIQGTVYYTLDGTTPIGSHGKGEKTTRVSSLKKHHVERNGDEWWVSETINLPKIGEKMAYKIGFGATNTTQHYQRQQLLLFPEGRELMMRWHGGKTLEEAWRINILRGLKTFNSTLPDTGYLYQNRGTGFTDPICGGLLWIGIVLLLIRFVRSLPHRDLNQFTPHIIGDSLTLIGFFSLYLGFAFLITKAPQYTRLLVILPFFAYSVSLGLCSLSSFLTKPLQGKTKLFSQTLFLCATIATIGFLNIHAIKKNNDRWLSEGNLDDYLVRFADLTLKPNPTKRWVLIQDEELCKTSRWYIPHYVWGTSSQPLWPEWARDWKKTTAKPSELSPENLKDNTILITTQSTLNTHLSTWEKLAPDISFQKRVISNLTPEKFAANNIGKCGTHKPTQLFQKHIGSAEEVITLTRPHATKPFLSLLETHKPSRVQWVHHNPILPVPCPTCGVSHKKEFDDSTDKISIWVKKEQSQTTTDGYVYYTTNGDDPIGSYGQGTKHTSVAKMTKIGDYGDQEWWQAIIEKPPDGTVLTYSIGFFDAKDNTLFAVELTKKPAPPLRTSTELSKEEAEIAETISLECHPKK